MFLQGIVKFCDEVNAMKKLRRKKWTPKILGHLRLNLLIHLCANIDRSSTWLLSKNFEFKNVMVGQNGASI
jgi:hypothetical protein